MITIKQAIDKVKEYSSKTKCVSGCHHGNCYIFAMEDKEKDPHGYDALYAVDKTSGEVFNYSPASDLFELLSDFETKPIAVQEVPE